MHIESARDALDHYLLDLLTPVPEHGAADRNLLPTERAVPYAAPGLVAKQPISAEPQAFSFVDADKARLQALLDTQFAVLPPVSVKESVTPVVPVHLEQKLLLEAHDEQVITDNNPADEISDWLDNGRPSWAQSRFDVLLLKVSGLSIAVPLVVLGHIYTIGSGLNRLPGQATWCMGIFASNRGPVRTINTAQFVMPERYQPEFLQTAKYIVTLHPLSDSDESVPWGLAVDEVTHSIAIGPDDVTWRQSRTKRPWLAGTVKSHMCALLDIPRMAKTLSAQTFVGA